jgi:hypothetical protein
LAHLRTVKVFHGRGCRHLKQTDPLSVADVL